MLNQNPDFKAVASASVGYLLSEAGRQALNEIFLDNAMFGHFQGPTSTRAYAAFDSSGQLLAIVGDSAKLQGSKTSFIFGLSIESSAGIGSASNPETLNFTPFRAPNEDEGHVPYRVQSNVERVCKEINEALGGGK